MVSLFYRFWCQLGLQLGPNLASKTAQNSKKWLQKTFVLLPEEGSEYDLQFQHRFGPSWPRFWKVLGWILGPKTAPRPSQDACKTAPDASETPQTASKTPRACEGREQCQEHSLTHDGPNLKLHNAVLLTFFQTIKRPIQKHGAAVLPPRGSSTSKSSFL